MSSRLTSGASDKDGESGLSRRNSETNMPLTGNSIYKYRALKSMPALTSHSRREDHTVSDSALAAMHKLHEDYMVRRKASKNRKMQPSERLSEAKLNEALGQKGSWQVYGELPLGKERPFNVRTLKAVPRRDPAKLLSKTVGTVVGGR
eukprot:TRINITY_DN26329_c0_g1_i1.p1 TRINITY_DN26329_c0_g1~~TRINITY_DN26329_c0_g1_i1.p1  ORF type:complete len:148 (-),score=14.16 TRINITY_DN26329_c0_g1_i1:57-500(-)